MSFAQRLKKSAAAVAVLLAIAFLVTPYTLFLNNQTEFNAGILSLLQYELLYLFCLWLIVSVVVALVPGKLFEIVLCGTLAVILGIYFQSSFLVWDYGIFNGEEIDWENLRRFGLIDASVWATIFLGVFCLRRKVIPNLSRIIGFVFLVTLASSAAQTFSKPVRFFSEPQREISSNLFKFSAERNILVIILDSFLAPSFEAIIEHDKALKEKFNGFTFYRNTLASFSTTAPSIPAMLSGEQYDNKEPMKEFLARTLGDNALPARAAAANFDVNLITLPQLCSKIKEPCRSLSKIVSRDQRLGEQRELAELLDLALFRAAPHQLKKEIYNDEHWFLQRILMHQGTPRPLFDSLAAAEIFEENVATGLERPTFKFLHFLLPHPPYRMDKNCARLDGKPRKEKELYEDQGACALRFTAKILARLKKLDVFKQSMILVSADHGHSLHYLPKKRPNGFPILEQAMPLLLVKPFGSDDAEPLAISNAPASSQDLPKTIAEAAALRGNFSGANILALTESTVRERSYRAYGWRDSFWKKDYLPKMEEFFVRGHVREPDDWARGPVFPPGEH